MKLCQWLASVVLGGVVLAPAAWGEFSQVPSNGSPAATGSLKQSQSLAIPRTAMPLQGTAGVTAPGTLPASHAAAAGGTGLKKMGGSKIVGIKAGTSTNALSGTRPNFQVQALPPNLSGNAQNLLMDAHNLLSSALMDYNGHRARAMAMIARLVGDKPPYPGLRKGSENQLSSDEKLITARYDLQQALARMPPTTNKKGKTIPARGSAGVSRAIGEINAALGTR